MHTALCVSPTDHNYLRSDLRECAIWGKNTLQAGYDVRQKAVDDLDELARTIEGTKNRSL
jgi:hypothetical protein